MQTDQLRLFPLPKGRKSPPPYRAFWDRAIPASEFERGDHNIGVSTTGLLVLDVDAHKGGLETLAMLEMAYGPLPKTYTVRTPRGGLHIYFKAPYPIANSVEKLGPGIDVRSHHGYVVGAGSVTQASDESAAGEYVVEVDAPHVDAPDWLAELCDKVVERGVATVDVPELDTPQAVGRARAYLETREPAVYLSHGDDWTFKTAAAVMDFGVSPEMTLELMSEPGGWNERCSPPWDPEGLERKVENARRHRKNGIGSSDPKAEFEPVSEPPSGIEPRLAQVLLATPAKPRKWLLGHVAIRKRVSILIAPPGAGKSTLTLAMAASVATGKPILGMKVHEQCAAWLYNNEDDDEEMNLRLRATLQFNGIAEQDIQGRLYVNTGERVPFVVAKRNRDDQLRRTAEVQQAIDFIRANGIGLAVFDPFAEMHEGDENDNIEMGRVTAWFRWIAQQANCAVILVHHTRKLPAGSSDGHAGNMDSGRGASSINGVAKGAIQTLYGMSEKDAKRAGVPANQRHLYVRLDDGKMTSALSSGKATWFKRETVQVPIPEEGVFEPVGVLSPIELAEVEVEMGPASEIVDSIILAAIGDQQRISVEAAVGAIIDSPLYAGDRDRDAVRKVLKREGEKSNVWRKVATGATGKGAYTIERLHIDPPKNEENDLSGEPVQTDSDML